MASKKTTTPVVEAAPAPVYGTSELVNSMILANSSQPIEPVEIAGRVVRSSAEANVAVNAVSAVGPMAHNLTVIGLDSTLADLRKEHRRMTLEVIPAANRRVTAEEEAVEIAKKKDLEAAKKEAAERSIKKVNALRGVVGGSPYSWNVDADVKVSNDESGISMSISINLPVNKSKEGEQLSLRYEETTFRKWSAAVVSAEKAHGMAEKALNKARADAATLRDSVNRPDELERSMRARGTRSLMRSVGMGSVVDQADDEGRIIARETIDKLKG